jgi:hypothetical protein
MNLRDFRDNGKCFVVCADEKLTAFIELEKIACDARSRGLIQFDLN